MLSKLVDEFIAGRPTPWEAFGMAMLIMCAILVLIAVAAVVSDYVIDPIVKRINQREKTK